MRFGLSCILVHSPQMTVNLGPLCTALSPGLPSTDPATLEGQVSVRWSSRGKSHEKAVPRVQFWGLRCQLT